MTIVIMGGHSWGSGDTLAAAKESFRRNYGRLSDGYATYTFPPELTFRSVDQMGRLSWTFEPGHEDIQPTVTVTKPRRAHA